MRKREYWALVTPSLVVMVSLLAVPLYRTLEWSLQKVNYGDPGTFIGLQNYTTALSDARFQAGRRLHGGAHPGRHRDPARSRLPPGHRGEQTPSDAPARARAAPAGVCHPRSGRRDDVLLALRLQLRGPVNYFIAQLTGQDLLWFTDTWPNRVVLVLNIVWFLLPFAMLVILAGLQSVNPEVLEAAKIDGAGPFRLHWNVIIPSVRGVIGFVILISLMDVVRIFDPLVALSPQAAAIGNESIMFYIYSVAFKDGGQQLGLGSAINVLLIIIIGYCSCRRSEPPPEKGADDERGDTAGSRPSESWRSRTRRGGDG
jgi:multiple sugar transport system permease protein/N,N'-diacetylchitobiose transport system permease protein